MIVFEIVSLFSDAKRNEKKQISRKETKWEKKLQSEELKWKKRIDICGKIVEERVFQEDGKQIETNFF